MAIFLRVLLALIICAHATPVAPSNATSTAAPSAALAATGAALFARASGELAELSRSASPHDFRSSLRRASAFASDFCDVLGVSCTLERALAKVRSRFWPATSRARDAEVASEWVKAACARPTSSSLPPAACKALRKSLRSDKRAALKDALRRRPALQSALGDLRSALSASAQVAVRPARALRDAAGVAILARASKVLAGGAAANKTRRLHALRICVKNLRLSLESFAVVAELVFAGAGALALSLAARAADVQGALGAILDAAMLEHTISRHRYSGVFAAMVASEIAEAAALSADQVSAALALGSDASAFAVGLLRADAGVELGSASDQMATCRERMRVARNL